MEEVEGGSAARDASAIAVEAAAGDSSESCISVHRAPMLLNGDLRWRFGGCDWLRGTMGVMRVGSERLDASPWSLKA